MQVRELVAAAIAWALEYERNNNFQLEKGWDVIQDHKKLKQGISLSILGSSSFYKNKAKKLKNGSQNNRASKNSIGSSDSIIVAEKGEK